MGYHVSIVKTAGGDIKAISKKEAREYLDTVKELAIDEDRFGNLVISYEKMGDESPILMWQEGEIWAKNPDNFALQLMIDIAENLGARVRGDELETYKTPSETFIHPDDQAEYLKRESRRKNLKRQLLYRKVMSRLAVVAFFIFLGILAKIIFRF